MCRGAEGQYSHIFENEGSTLLTENHGKKIIQWANSGEGYTPVVRKDDTPASDITDDLASVKKEIIAHCTKLGGTKNAELMATLKTFVPSGNPNGIKDVDTARECLEKIKTINPIEA